MACMSFQTPQSHLSFVYTFKDAPLRPSHTSDLFYPKWNIFASKNGTFFQKCVITSLFLDWQRRGCLQMEVGEPGVLGRAFGREIGWENQRSMGITICVCVCGTLHTSTLVITSYRKARMSRFSDF